MEIARILSEELKIPTSSVQAVLDLLKEECTVPFIARYRKERTGNLDEVEIVAIRNRYEEIQQLLKRKEAVVASLRENGHATEDLLARIESAKTLTEVEDLYLPYRPKRRTRAMIAIEKGCEPIAEILLKNEEPKKAELLKILESCPDLKSTEELLAGAQDIVAERLSETKVVRERLREIVQSKGTLAIKKAKGSNEDPLFAAFYQKEELLRSIPSHRFLAIMRGVEESKLSVKIVVEEQEVFRAIVGGYGIRQSVVPPLNAAIADSWERLIQPSLENEFLKETKLRADQTAIQVFAENLRNLLLAPPLGQKAIISVDPGLRTGCKIVVLSAQGTLLEHSVVYPLEPHLKTTETRSFLEKWISKYQIQAIAVGNGTGGREVFDFLTSCGWKIPVISVSESGASVYSASEIARDEFPDFDLTVRGAISIGRRLLDPLAELVKIDPKSIGVGQYQHDVDQKLLKKNLDDVVTSCVNKVGVDVNTASRPILTYISGLNGQLAGKLIEYRTKNGPFQTRSDFLKVKGMGAKTFEQAAGFLRIRGGHNPLDASAVHPETYETVERIARELKLTVQELVGKSGLRPLIQPLQSRLGLKDVTLEDLVQELEKPGVDPRKTFESVEFDPQIRRITDLKEGQILHGVVTNVTAFGAFVDVGVHQDGLVHISQLADRFVKDPFEVVKVGQAVRVKVTGVEVERKRIALSIKEAK